MTRSDAIVCDQGKSARQPDEDDNKLDQSHYSSVIRPHKGGKLGIQRCWCFELALVRLHPPTGLFSAVVSCKRLRSEVQDDAGFEPPHCADVGVAAALHILLGGRRDDALLHNKHPSSVG
eukprot:5391871-Pleurochrysis_carterae.AAC.4